MSIYRTIARLAVVSAFNNYGQVAAGQKWPTLAGPNIFDSKIEPVEDMAVDRAFPCCVVYTDYDSSNWNYSRGVHEDRLLTVNLEMLVVQAAQKLAENGGIESYTLECPVTDSEIETTLDMFEVQVFDALNNGSIASDCFAYICGSWKTMVSRRGASIEGGQRLAARQITMEMKAIRDNTSGVIPEPIEDFLQELEKHEDYAERVVLIRTMLTRHAQGTDNDRRKKLFGYSTGMAKILGAPTGIEVLLPANLTFHYNEVRP